MERWLTLFVMTQKGHEVLKAVNEKFHKSIAAVVSGRDSNIKKDYYDEIKELCGTAGLQFHDRKEAYEVTTLYAIAVSWRWRIDVSNTRLIVFHDSLLPRYRGYNPLVSALINGENTIGVSAVFADEEFDSGEIIAQSATSISYPIRIQEAIELITQNYVELSLQLAQEIMDGTLLKGVQQDEIEASYSLWRDEEDYRVDWEQSSVFLKRFIDAVGFPYKGASSTVDGQKVRITDAEVVPDVLIENRTPGKVIFVKDSKPIVVCGQGLLRIDELVDDKSNESMLPLGRFRVRFV
jgi:methionyl-tRNA formyltransferase